MNAHWHFIIFDTIPIFKLSADHLSEVEQVQSETFLINIFQDVSPDKWSDTAISSIHHEFFFHNTHVLLVLA